MALEVIAVAISHPRLGGIFHPEHPTGSMKVALQDMVCAAVYRVQQKPSETRQPTLPRLPEAICRVYAALQKYGGMQRMAKVLRDTCGACGLDANIVIQEHLQYVAKWATKGRNGVPADIEETRKLLPLHRVNMVQHSHNAYPVLPPLQPFIKITSNVMTGPRANIDGLLEAPEPLRSAILLGRSPGLAMGNEGCAEPRGRTHHARARTS
jgi:hypothetical protein